MDVSIIAHSEDLDGVASAVLADYMLTKLGANVHVFFTSYNQLTSIIDEASKCDELWVMDLSLRDSVVLSSFENPYHVKIFDHHPDSKCIIDQCNAINDRSSITQKFDIHYDSSGSSCTTDLIYEFTKEERLCEPFNTPDNALKLLVGAAHSIDLWIRDDPNGQYLSDVIDILGPDKVYQILKEDVSRADRANFTYEMEQALVECEANRVASIDLAWKTNMATAIPLIHNGEEVKLHIHAAKCLGFESEVAEKFRYDGNVIVALIPLDEGTLSLRTTEDSIAATGVTANAVANVCGGGGHPCAAGAPLPKHITRVEALLDYVTSVIKELYTETSR